MARNSNGTVLDKLKLELESQLQQVRSYSDEDTQLNTAITALQ